MDKICQHCKQTKPLDSFAKSKRAKDGLQVWCRNCCKDHKEHPWQRTSIADRTTKRCSLCKIEQAVELFVKRPKGWDSWCKSCKRKRAKEYGREILTAEQKQDRRIKKRTRVLQEHFNISQILFDAILARQEGRCAICRTSKPTSDGRNWSIDHDHACCPGKKSCGKCVRGLLCTKCNTILGLMNDDTNLFGAISWYLATPPARDVLGLPALHDIPSKVVEQITGSLLRRWFPDQYPENTLLPTAE